MKTFNFEVDQKVTMWHRTSVDVEAESLEEAKEKMKVFAKKEHEYSDVAEILEEESIPVNYDFLTTEYLYDTAEGMTIEENNNAPTIEVVYNDETIIRNSEEL
jgi:hypothetical protein